MTPEIPDWARRERQQDMEWIKENLHVFVPAAKAGFETHGRGAIMVDTTVQPMQGMGHPFGYFPQAVIETSDDEDMKRLVREYNPQEELVVVLLKPDDHISTYRFQAFQTVWRRRRRRR